jgi:hypothetical protein
VNESWKHRSSMYVFPQSFFFSATESILTKDCMGCQYLVAGKGKGTSGSYLSTANSTLRKAQKKHPSPTISLSSYDCGLLFERVCSSNPIQITDYPASSRYLYQASSQTMNKVGSEASIVGAYMYIRWLMLYYIQCVPLATEPGISLIISPLIRIMQRNLKRTYLIV